MADRNHNRSRSPAQQDNRTVRVKREGRERRSRSPAPHPHGGQGFGPIEADGRRVVKPDWLGNDLYIVSPALYDCVWSEGQRYPVVHEKNPHHGLDLTTFCTHMTAFVRSVLPYLYSEVPGFDDFYTEKLQHWTYDPRVMTVSVSENRYRDYTVWVPAFPLHAQTTVKKPRGQFRYWSLTPPRAIGTSDGKYRRVEYPSPDILPVNLSPELTNNAREIVARGQTFGPVRLPHLPFNESTWTLSRTYKHPHNYKQMDGPQDGWVEPSSGTSWDAVLSEGPGGSVCRVSVRFDGRLTKPLEELMSRKEAVKQEAIKQERALGKGRREFKPLARALF